MPSAEDHVLEDVPLSGDEGLHSSAANDGKESDSLLNGGSTSLKRHAAEDATIGSSNGSAFVKLISTEGDTSSTSNEAPSSPTQGSPQKRFKLSNDMDAANENGATHPLMTLANSQQPPRSSSPKGDQSQDGTAGEGDRSQSLPSGAATLPPGVIFAATSGSYMQSWMPSWPVAAQFVPTASGAGAPQFVSLAYPYGHVASLHPSGKMAIPSSASFPFVPTSFVPTIQPKDGANAVAAAQAAAAAEVQRKIKIGDAHHFTLHTDDPSKRFMTTTHLNNKKLTFMRLDTVEKPASKSSGPTLRARCKLVKELISYLAGGTPEDERIFRAAFAKFDKEAHILALKDIGMLVEKTRKSS